MNMSMRASSPAAFATRNQTSAFKRSLWIILLISSVLISAFAVVYIKDLYRRLFIDYQKLQDIQTQLYTDWGKLLLEESTWSTQARVQTVAEKRLDMKVPDTKEVKIVGN